MRVISIVFKENKKEYYFKMEDLEVNNNQNVVVMTSRGLEYATVVNSDVKNCNIPEENLMPVVRIATKKDHQDYKSNLEYARVSMEKFRNLLDDFKDLEMNLVGCEVTLDRSKILFQYVSDDRVDFRELLKVLASNFKCRIELKQIGARDKAKLVGGLGPCGMESCCSRYLKDFDNISINMAKNQMLSLNPTKISGLCGRLLCCLKYENDQYKTQKANFPKIGSRVTYDKNEYKITGINILLDTVKIEGNGIIKMVSKEEIKW